MPRSLELGAERGDFLLVERDVDLAVGEDALLRFEAQRPLHQRLVLAEEQIIGVRPVDAADLVDVAEALRDDERGLRAGALQDGVDGDGRAVEKKPGLGIARAGLLDAGCDALDEMVGRRERLAEGEGSGARVEGGDVGESAADVGGETQAGRA